MILTSKHDISWTHEEPQTNAKNAYVCATHSPLLPGDEGSKIKAIPKQEADGRGPASILIEFAVAPIHLNALPGFQFNFSQVGTHLQGFHLQDNRVDGALRSIQDGKVLVVS